METIILKNIVPNRLWEACPEIRDQRYICQIWYDNCKEIYWAFANPVPNLDGVSMLAHEGQSMDEAISALHAHFLPRFFFWLEPGPWTPQTVER